MYSRNFSKKVGNLRSASFFFSCHKLRSFSVSYQISCLISSNPYVWTGINSSNIDGLQSLPTISMVLSGRIGMKNQGGSEIKCVQFNVQRSQSKISRRHWNLCSDSHLKNHDLGLISGSLPDAIREAWHLWDCFNIHIKFNHPKC